MKMAYNWSWLKKKNFFMLLPFQQLIQSLTRRADGNFCPQVAFKMNKIIELKRKFSWKLSSEYEIEISVI